MTDPREDREPIGHEGAEAVWHEHDLEDVPRNEHEPDLPPGAED